LEDDFDPLVSLLTEIQSKLNLQRPNASFPAPHAPRLKRTNRGLQFLARCIYHSNIPRV
jgi:hypothetical protein